MNIHAWTYLLSSTLPMVGIGFSIADGTVIPAAFLGALVGFFWTLTLLEVLGVGDEWRRR